MADVQGVVAVERITRLFDRSAAGTRDLVLAYGPRVDTTRLASSIQTHFSRDSLLHSTAALLQDEASPSLFSELHEWFLSDSIRAIENKAWTALGRETSEEFEARMKRSRPDPRVADLANRLEQAKRSGFMLNSYLTAEQEARFRVIAGAQTELPRPGPWSAAQHAAGLQQIIDVSRMEALQIVEALSEEETWRLIRAYETPSGQWYVSAYPRAAELALMRAARHVVSDVEDGRL